MVLKYVPKEDVNNYPLIEFNGNIHLIDNEKELLSHIDYILRHDVIGFDTETKPSFTKGVIHSISLLQLSVKDDVFLLRLDKIGLHKKIIKILTNPDIIKVGIDVKNDLLALKKIHTFQESGFIDLNILATNKGFKSIGAVKLSIMLLGFRISKKQRLSDWSANKLTHAQMNYAAIDAWICPKILESFSANLLFP